ncbi:MAG: hypothetical protein IPL61_34900 [Myxococcales bacterium]|nr:hypothetical protein [Myxococcales bacterium]
MIAEVEQALARDGSFNERWAAARHYLASGLDAEARPSVDALEAAAVEPHERAIAAHLAAAVGDRERSRRLLAGLDVAGADAANDDDAFALGYVLRALVLLGDDAPAAALAARLGDDDAAAAATGAGEDLARAGQLERAEAWATAASRGGDASAWLAVGEAWAARSDTVRAREPLARAVQLARQHEPRRGAHLARAAAIHVRLGEGAKAAALAREVVGAEPDGSTADPRHLLAAAVAGNDRASVQRLVGEAWSGARTVEQLRAMVVVARYHLAFALPLPRAARGDRRAYADELLRFAEAHAGELTDAYAVDALRADLARARLALGDVAGALAHARRIPQLGTRVWISIEIVARLAGAP